jgi:hypothetical protein
MRRVAPPPPQEAKESLVGVWNGVRVWLSVGYQDMGVWWAAGGLLPAGLFVYLGCRGFLGRLGWRVYRVLRAVRVPGMQTRTARTNFGYRGLQPVLGFGFNRFGLYGYGFGLYGFGDRVSGFMPSPRFIRRLLFQRPLANGSLDALGYLYPLHSPI